MIQTVLLARLGDTVDEVVILEWCVEPGDHVAVGDPLVRVETDKVDVDIESPFTGTVVECLVAEDDEVATGSALCRIDISE
jgi:pyruvate dehydrogenase E2 component (dihydrolipoamide acetyltransferase)